MSTFNSVQSCVKDKWCNKREQETLVFALSLDCFCYSPLGILAEMKLHCNHPDTPQHTQTYTSLPGVGCLGTGAITYTN